MVIVDGGPCDCCAGSSGGSSGPGGSSGGGSSGTGRSVIFCSGCPRCNGGPYPRNPIVTFTNVNNIDFPNWCGCLTEGESIILELASCDSQSVFWRYSNNVDTTNNCNQFVARCQISISLTCNVNGGWNITIAFTMRLRSDSTCTSSTQYSLSGVAESSCSPLMIVFTQMNRVQTGLTPAVCGGDPSGVRGSVPPYFTATVTE